MNTFRKSVLAAGTAALIFSGAASGALAAPASSSAAAAVQNAISDPVIQVRKGGKKWSGKWDGGKKFKWSGKWRGHHHSRGPDFDDIWPYFALGLFGSAIAGHHAYGYAPYGYYCHPYDRYC